METTVTPTNLCAPTGPRVYPLAFANAIVKMFDDLVTGGEGKPPFFPVPEFGGADLFRDCLWSDWPEARMYSVLRYLRGNKNLCCPLYLKSSFPTPFELYYKREKGKNATDGC